jgi:predicted metal-dependent enzyme (double-stranded beta helix superfamily)
VRVEIWQCDQNGRYRHNRDDHPAEMDEYFQGFGQTRTDKAGRYRIDAVSDGQPAIREVVSAALNRPAQVSAWFGEPGHAGIDTLYRSNSLTIINFTWAPYMSLMPQNHNMFALIGLYEGREDNIFWRRTDSTIEAAGTKTLGQGEAATLGRDIIHSVLNRTRRMTRALHIYGGDFFEPEEPRKEWDPETLEERLYDVEAARRLFREAEERIYMKR